MRQHLLPSAFRRDEWIGTHLAYANVAFRPEAPSQRRARMRWSGNWLPCNERLTFSPQDRVSDGLGILSRQLMSEAARKTVLVVEDNEAYRAALETAIRRKGYRILVAANHQQAVEALESDARIDLLLTDIVLPGVHGFTLARMAIVRRPALRVLYMSVHTDLPRYEREFGLGKVVEKTGDPDDIIAAIDAEFAAP
jgi:CheY-like chemotaxis protein